MVSPVYSTVVLSPNAAVVVCLPSDLARAASQPVVAALPVAKDNAALLLALSLIRQTDATDVSGVSTSRKDGRTSLSLSPALSLSKLFRPFSKPCRALLRPPID